MVDSGRLRAILDRVDVDLQRLYDLAGTPVDVLIGELDRLDAVKYRFVTAIEGLIDAAHHVIASERLRAATTYADAFAVLGEASLIDTELAAAAQEIARFRNLLVHGYAEVDDDRVVTVPEFGGRKSAANGSRRVEPRLRGGTPACRGTQVGLPLPRQAVPGLTGWPVRAQRNADNLICQPA